MYQQEFEDAELDLLKVMLTLRSRDGGHRTVEEAMIEKFGWTKDDFKKYLLDTTSHIAVADVKPKAGDFRLQLGPTIKRGGETFDTVKTGMFSKFEGSGFAIYVLDADGAMYADRHKVSLFHHSSFLGGGDVTGAGELRVEGGTLATSRTRAATTSRASRRWPPRCWRCGPRRSTSWARSSPSSTPATSRA